ncbi:MAG: hypothetical protein GX639_01695 [Fibrobacter sp.]|nr:hypothetical protein [Fibrobacter sp.]
MGEHHRKLTLITAGHLFFKSAFHYPADSSPGVIVESSVVLDTSWNIIAYRSSGRVSQNDSCTIQMGTTLLF